MFRIYLLVLLIITFASCSEKKNSERHIEEIRISGNAQGTTFSIIFLDSLARDFSKEVDSILEAVDLSVSTYRGNSIISKINRNDTSVIIDPVFSSIFKLSEEISEKTSGAFDVTVGPFVNAWGFGKNNRANTDDNFIDSLKSFVGFNNVRLEGVKLIKNDPRMQIDFNAIAQGFTVDFIADFFEDKGIWNYMIELGGEVKANGFNFSGESWKIGIDKPIEGGAEERELSLIIQLNNRALATSGNYRKFYEEDGKKYSHTINPFTGYPVQHNLLSASVLTEKCGVADAYATAFMVMGVEKTLNFLNQNNDFDLEVYLIYQEEKGEMKVFKSQGFAAVIVEALD